MKETAHEMWGWIRLETLRQDLRYGARMAARNPGFTLLITGLLALGIGASTVIFSLFEAVFLRTLPVRHPEELVRMVQKSRLPTVPPQSNFVYPYYKALLEHSRTLSVVFGETGVDWRFAMSDPAPAEQITVDAVTPEFFEALGARALHGRVLLPQDNAETPGMLPAVLSYGFWSRRFGRDPSVLNRRSLLVNGQRFLIVGVTPRDFNGLTLDTVPDVCVPLRAFLLLLKYPKDWMSFELSGRLKPGIARSQAEAECLVLWRSTMENFYRNVWKLPPQSVERQLATGMQLEPSARGVSILRYRYGDALKLLMVSVAVLLLIFCTNIAGLLLERAAARQQEISVRLAVGATRWRLVRQLLAENLLLAGLGAAGGLLVALAGLPLAIRAMPPIRRYPSPDLVPLSLEVGINWRVFLFLLAVSLVITLLFSVSPALAVSRLNLDTLLRSARASAGVRGRQALIALQIALCTFLLATASLFVRTFRQLQRIDPGFDRNHIATFTLDFPNNYAGKVDVFLKTLTERVRAIPGVVSAGSSAMGVMRGTGWPATVAQIGQRITYADFINSSANNVSPGYFTAMGMHILNGRECTPSDAPETGKKITGPLKAVVNKTFQRRFFPNTQAVGKLFGTGDAGQVAGANKDPTYEIIGVVNDARYTTLRHWLKPTFYRCNTYFGGFVLNVRTRTRPDAMFEPVRKALASLDPALPFTEVHTMAEEVDNTIAGERITAALTALFGGVASLLVGVGIYGLLAYVVTQRRREIGVRMALGAEPAQIGKLIARQTFAMTLVGIIAGLVAAFAVAPAIRSLLYAVSPQDPRSLVAAVILVALTVAAGTIIPVVRATRAEPMVALRYE
jgi:predicted permease